MRAATPWRVLAAEGVRAAAGRARDRLAEARRRRSFASLDVFGAALEATLGLPPAAFPLLVLSAAPPAARAGGVQAALLARLDALEAEGRPVALLYPRPGAWRLELADGALRRAAELPADAPPHPAALADAELERVVAWAVERCGARALQVEGVAGLPLHSLERLAGEGLPLVLALHDFALFCPRPHLLEEPARRFCGYCRDLERCAACLAAGWPAAAAPGQPADFDTLHELEGFQARRRELGAALLARSAAAVFPSAFLRRQHAALFPGALPGRTAVIPPARPPGRLPGTAGRRAPGPIGGVRRVALVGGARAHKGAEVFAAVVERLAGLGAGDGRELAFTVYGGGEAALLRRLRRLPGVAVRGYYPAGALPRLLRRDHIDLALLLSIVPESYSLALSECRLAGVPVLAFDHGAVADRLRAEEGGLLVDPAAGAAGIAERLAALARGEAAVPPLAPHLDLDADAAGRVAEEWLALYRELGCG